MDAETPGQDRSGRRARLIEAGLAAGLALVLALVGISGWNLSLAVPFEFSWDSLTGQSLVKGVLDNGWHLTNDSIGRSLRDAVARLPAERQQPPLPADQGARYIHGDHVVVFNLFWLLGFPLAAVTAWWVMRDLGLPGIAAVTCGVIYALLPYHFWRGEGHVFLSAYYAVPLGCWLVLRVLARRPLAELRQGTGPVRSRLRLRSLLLPAAFCIVLGSTGIYYAVFAILLLCFSALVVVWDREGRRPAVEGIAAAGLIGLVLLLNLLPSIGYHADNGDNPVVAKRGPGESEQYGLSLIGMLLPRDEHRVAELADWKEDFMTRTPTPGEGASLGFIAAGGLLFCFLLVLRSALARGSGRAPPALQAAALAATLAFLIGTVGGISSIFARTVGPEIRSWSRISIFIAFFALVAVGWGLAWVCGRLAQRPGRNGRILPVAAMGVVLAFAVWDQVGPAHPRPVRSRLHRAAVGSDEAFVEELEAELPDGAMVMQLPYLKFPEGYPTRGAMNDHDPFRGYLHSESLRWSYGAMKGRSADLLACLREAPVPVLVDAAQAWGYDAIWIDRVGYLEDAEDIEAGLREATGGEEIESPDQRFVAFLVPEVAARARAAALEEALPQDGDEIQDCGPIAAAAGVPKLGSA